MNASTKIALRLSDTGKLLYSTPSLIIIRTIFQKYVYYVYLFTFLA